MTKIKRFALIITTITLISAGCTDTGHELSADAISTPQPTFDKLRQSETLPETSPLEIQAFDTPSIGTPQEKVATKLIAEIDASSKSNPSPTPTPTPKPTPLIQKSAEPTKKAVASSCHPSYSGCLPNDGGDVDCAGGKGNGPHYAKGPIKVHGADVFDLDRDGDGIACEK